MLSKFIFKCLNKTSPINFHTWFILTSQLHTHNTISKFYNIVISVPTRTLFIPIARTSYYGLKLIKVLGSKMWNKLPPLLRNYDSLNRFLKELKKIMINSYDK